MEKTTAIRDFRVWILAGAYGACFGLELTMNNMLVLYYVDNFNFSLTIAGVIGIGFGSMNLFARPLGGWLADTLGLKKEEDKVFLLFFMVLFSGLLLTALMSCTHWGWSLSILILFSTIIKMSQGVTFAMVPFIKSGSLGFVTGLVGAGGNVGAVLIGLLMGLSFLTWSQALVFAGLAIGFLAPFILLLNEQTFSQFKGLL